MTRAKTMRAYAAELAALYKKNGSLDPRIVVDWARKNADSALHSCFEWDDTKAANEHRLLQARHLITSVEVEYPDGKVRQVYVSPMNQRGREGYSTLVEIMNDKQRRDNFLAQALAEYERLGDRYQSIVELAEVRAAVGRVKGGRRVAKKRAA